MDMEEGRLGSPVKLSWLLYEYSSRLTRECDARSSSGDARFPFEGWRPSCV